jgi:uncharacterized protein
MRFLVRLGSSGLPPGKFLASVRSLGKSVGVEVRNPKWTSNGALEADVFSPTRGDFELFLSAVGPLHSLVFSRDLNEAPHHLSEEESFSVARGYFNDERYWECHEVLEGVWRLKEGEEKRFLQAIILVCAAFVHHQKGEAAVAFSVLERASRQLEFQAQVYHGIDVGLLQSNVRQALQKREFSNFRV